MARMNLDHVVEEHLDPSDLCNVVFQTCSQVLNLFDAISTDAQAITELCNHVIEMFDNGSATFSIQLTEAEQAGIIEELVDVYTYEEEVEIPEELDED